MSFWISWLKKVNILFDMLSNCYFTRKRKMVGLEPILMCRKSKGWRTALFNPFWYALRILLLRDIVKVIWMRVWSYIRLRWPADERFALPRLGWYQFADSEGRKGLSGLNRILVLGARDSRHLLCATRTQVLKCRKTAVFLKKRIRHALVTDVAVFLRLITKIIFLWRCALANGTKTRKNYEKTAPYHNHLLFQTRQ